jgi:hypothetical protein
VGPVNVTLYPPVPVRFAVSCPVLLIRRYILELSLFIHTWIRSVGEDTMLWGQYSQQPIATDQPAGQGTANGVK